MLMATLELNSRDFAKINGRLWERLMPPQSNNGADANETSRLVDSSTPDHPARDRRDQQAAAAAAAMADEGHQRAMFSAKVQHSDGRDEAAVPVHRNRTVSSLSPNAPDAQRKPPHPMAPQQQPAISLFSGDEDGDVPASVRGASSGGRGVSRATRHGIASGEFPQPSRQPSLRPWEWPDVFRGHKGRISGSELWPTVHCGPTDNVEEGLRYSTPYEPRSFTRDNTPSGEGEDEGREDTGEDGFAPDGWEEAMGKASGEGHREDDGGIERRRSCGGLEQVKKRLWGSMFEAAGASITRRARATHGNAAKSSVEDEREDQRDWHTEGRVCQEEEDEERAGNHTLPPKSGAVHNTSSSTVYPRGEVGPNSGTDQDVFQTRRCPPPPRSWRTWGTDGVGGDDAGIEGDRGGDTAAGKYSNVKSESGGRHKDGDNDGQHDVRTSGNVPARLTAEENAPASSGGSHVIRRGTVASGQAATAVAEGDASLERKRSGFTNVEAVGALDGGGNSGGGGAREGRGGVTAAGGARAGKGGTRRGQFPPLPGTAKPRSRKKKAKHGDHVLLAPRSSSSGYGHYQVGVSTLADRSLARGEGGGEQRKKNYPSPGSRKREGREPGQYEDDINMEDGRGNAGGNDVAGSSHAWLDDEEGRPEGKRGPSGRRPGDVQKEDPTAADCGKRGDTSGLVRGGGAAAGDAGNADGGGCGGPEVGAVPPDVDGDGVWLSLPAFPDEGGRM